MNNKASKCVAQGAAVWDEKLNALNDEQVHKELMRKLEKVKGGWEFDGEYYFSSVDNGNAYRWAFHGLSDDDVRLILQRGRSDEIIALIRAYSRSIPPKMHDHEGGDLHCGSEKALLAEEFQERIAQRNVRDEIAAYVSYQGFGASGQDVLLKRGNHEELMWYLSRHGLLPDQQRQLLERDNREEVMLHITHHGLSSSLEKYLLKRGRHEEIMAYISKEGGRFCGAFCEAELQTALLQRGNHEEIMAFISKGREFGPAEQRQLLNRNNREETELYISRCGLDEQLLNEMFDQMEADGSTGDFYRYISLRELSVPMQVRMLKTVKSPEFYAYINRYGLWNETHETLLECRSEDEIAGYLERHHFLADAAESKLAAMKSTRLNKIYIREYPYSIGGFAKKLLEVRPLDYEALTDAFLKLNVYTKNEKAAELMKSGSCEQVIAYFRENKKTVYGKELIQLFFRNDPEVFETCLALIGDRICLQ